MPMYVYAVVLPDGSEGESFEVLQSMSEPSLTRHPDTGEPVRRLLSVPNAGRKAGITSKADLSTKNLERLGFTQYKKAGGGKYEKTAGQGPDMISKD